MSFWAAIMVPCAASVSAGTSSNGWPQRAGGESFSEGLRQRPGTGGCRVVAGKCRGMRLQRGQASTSSRW